MKHLLRSLVLLAGAVLLVAACNGGSDTTEPFDTTIYNEEVTTTPTPVVTPTATPEAVPPTVAPAPTETPEPTATPEVLPTAIGVILTATEGTDEYAAQEALQRYWAVQLDWNLNAANFDIGRIDDVTWPGSNANERANARVQELLDAGAVIRYQVPPERAFVKTTFWADDEIWFDTCHPSTSYAYFPETGETEGEGGSTTTIVRSVISRETDSQDWRVKRIVRLGRVEGLVPCLDVPT